jgi:IS1 family transposase
VELVKIMLVRGIGIRDISTVKKNTVWLIYVYHRESGEIVAYVWGKRDMKTAKKLSKKIK